MALFAGLWQPCKASPGKFCTCMAPTAFDASVSAHERELCIWTVRIGHPAARPAVFAVALPASLLKLTRMGAVVTETTVTRHVDEFYFGKPFPFERGLMTLIAF